MRKYLKLRLPSRGADLFDCCDFPRFGTIMEMTKHASPFTLSNIENPAIERIHIRIDVITQPASDVRRNHMQ